MADTEEFYYEPEPGESLSTEVVTAVAKAHDEDVLDQRWVISDDDDNDGAGVELEYKADSSDGGSGGPVFGWWSGSPYVIGTHSGWETEYRFPWHQASHNLSAGGGALSSLIGWARSNW